MDSEAVDKPALRAVFLRFFSSRRRHTRCLSDWSSDVCSSDLVLSRASEPGARHIEGRNAGHVPLGWGMKKFIQSWAVNTLAVLVAVYMVPGIRFKDASLWTPFVTSLVLGILNAFIRPILMLFALPLLIFTLGLFRLVINALLLYFVSFLLGRYFVVDNFWAAFLGALV